MTEEEVVAPSASPIPSDHKRKHEELETEAPEHAGNQANSNAEPDEVEEPKDALSSDSLEAKRPRLDGQPDGPANANGFEEEKLPEPEKEVEDEPKEIRDGTEQEKAGEAPLEQVQETAENKEVDVKTDETVEPPSDNHLTGDNEQTSVENNCETENAQEPTNYDTKITNDEEIDETQTTTRKIEVPSSKVGVLIGKGGDTIRYLQYNSGAKIQITRDADADPSSVTRPVEIIGTLSSIEKAEKLITAVIAEADAGGSPSLVARGLPTTQAAGAADSIEIQVPNEKVGLIIGRGGENIKSMQTKSGARIQLIPQHLPEGDGSKERTVRVTGDKRQIEMAREMIMDVMNQTVRPSLSSNVKQQAYRPRGPTGPPQWGPRGPHPSQSMGYDYQQRGPYPSQMPNYQHPGYGSYPQQMPPRSSFGSGWEQRPHPSMQGPPPHSAGYDYYGGQGGHAVSAPLSTSISGPLPSPAMVPPHHQANYNYGQPQGQEYGHPGPYAQTAPQQNYGHMYEEPKYENHGAVQQPYGGHGGSQQYPQAGGHPGYPPQQQYGKPTYGMQGPPVQNYGPPRASQPGDIPYQGPVPSSQSYGPNVAPQQQYPYASGGPMQPTYPYGSVPQSDGYSQPPPATGQGYPQQGSQHVPSYGQAGGQQAGYGQVGPTGGYVSYPSQQGYPEQAAAQNSGSYAYQGTQDPNYGSGTVAAYSAPASGQQQGYAQATPAQPSYDQSAQQSGYGGTPGSAPASYGKNLSPQPGYAQYDSSQIYAAAPR
ncbi:far upstream element-binding protein 1 isoform X2 [Carica papaya]|uniref:far upstream element-binding protein 1 isoform X2 n=1 Tax=Carica papaya TaxID=3649 RepID=UPI000B8C84EF|nr:far upstream element-binding protein 1 isoform X2 [Carica papaya]